MSSSESDFDINDKFPEAEFYIEIKYIQDYFHLTKYQSFLSYYIHYHIWNH